MQQVFRLLSTAFFGLVTFSGSAFAQSGPPEKSGAEEQAVTDYLDVTITPKQNRKAIEDFRDAYVDLGNGRFIRFSDWIIRGVNKSDPGAGKSELDEMIERGDVAAALVGRQFENGNGAGVGMVIGGKYRKMSFEQIALSFGVDLLARAPGASTARGIYSTTSDPNHLYDPGTFMLGEIDFSGYPSLLDFIERHK